MDMKWNLLTAVILSLLLAAVSAAPSSGDKPRFNQSGLREPMEMKK